MIVKENSYRVVYNIIIMLSFVFRFRNSTHCASHVSRANIAWDNSYLSRCIHYSQSIGKTFKNIFIYLLNAKHFRKVVLS